MIAYITRIRIVVITITSIFLVFSNSSGIGSGFVSPDVSSLGKGQDICSLSRKDLVHSTKFPPYNLGTVLILFNVFMPAKFSMP